MADKVTTVAQARLGKRLGALGAAEMGPLDGAQP